MLHYIYTKLSENTQNTQSILWDKVIYYYYFIFFNLPCLGVKYIKTWLFFKCVKKKSRFKALTHKIKFLCRLFPRVLCHCHDDRYSRSAEMLYQGYVQLQLPLATHENGVQVLSGTNIKKYS